MRHSVLLGLCVKDKCEWVFFLTCLRVWSVTPYFTHVVTEWYCGAEYFLLVSASLNCVGNRVAAILKFIFYPIVSKKAALSLNLNSWTEKHCCVLLTAFLLCGICLLCWLQSKGQIIRWVRARSIPSSTVPLRAWELPHSHTHRHEYKNTRIYTHTQTLQVCHKLSAWVTVWKRERKKWSWETLNVSTHS